MPNERNTRTSSGSSRFYSVTIPAHGAIVLRRTDGTFILSSAITSENTTTNGPDIENNQRTVNTQSNENSIECPRFTLPSGIEYVKGQLEIGESTNYPHWQLMVVTERKVRSSFVRRAYPRAHVEISRSAALANYVWKDDTSVEGTRFELGTPPRALNPNSNTKGHDWEAIWETAKAGNFEEIPAHVRVSSYRVLKDIRKDHLKPIGCEKTIYVLHGETGTGKSRDAWKAATFDAYPKDPLTKYWDGYDGQHNVVIDEFRGGINISHMLRWLDRYPVIVEAKHGAVCLHSTRIWITSNLHPKFWYPDLDSETLNALLRRLILVEYTHSNTSLQ